MSALPGLGQHPHGTPGGTTSLRSLDGMRHTPEPATGKTQRRKTWELSANLHCSIIGTCLTAFELRQLLIKSGDTDARTASDHVLHGRGVRLAGQRDIAGKLLNKALDRRHETLIKRFSRVSHADDLRKLWREAFECGEIAGAYWAVLSHPSADADLVRDVFGEVHMLSHLVGSASRLDIARLTALQKEAEEKNAKILRQEQRLAAAAAERTLLQRQIDDLHEKLIRAEATRTIETGEPERRDAQLISRLETEKARADQLAERLREAETRERQAVELAERAARRAAALEQENGLFEAVLQGKKARIDDGSNSQRTGTVLYVGGRRNLFDRLRALAAERGVTLLLHDGGMEDNTTLLPALVGQAELVLFPVDHISHAAAGLVKRICRESSKPFIPLRSAGLSSFVATITGSALSHPAS